MIISPSEGRLGGIVLLWRSNYIRVSKLFVDRQYIHVHCDVPSQSSFLLTAIYTVPHSNLRLALCAKSKSLLNMDYHLEGVNR